MWGGSQFLTFVPFHGRWFTLLYISLFTIRSLVSKIHHAFFLITLLYASEYTYKIFLLISLSITKQNSFHSISVLILKLIKLMNKKFPF